ncbi:MAG: envelope stress response membrane protein PspB [Gammaproteobacteria bacterium]|jgi:phage shock protein B|nr:envelope stress response membrane protein PspB [Chromatiales bacterium]MDP6674991.1 envelope stress response membrane protein PspB [Gammaproteobacteria bacterium]
MSEVLGIIALTIVAPIWIISHYVTKWRLAKGLSHDEAQTLEELWKIAQGMETRVITLEAILDENVDGWRNKS